ncbi:probable serine/threonine-protein kinase DDB_G0272254 [Asparagus officinalis]|uniref:probable serine/threonine-protein kinase DDB_G0272254 n=1 Tax=Asparagus officinalis TaxID=4686 RepID=UPI00098DE7DD|nr:probable serine/threonine-protein kinase DDB_G0272254 [Asparagus officinalis]
METPPPEELLKKIQDLEAGHAKLKQEISSLMPPASPPRAPLPSAMPALGDGGSQTFRLSERQYLNILQSMGQSVHIFDLDGRIIYWNRSAENLYGFSPSEALGQDAIGLLIDSSDFEIANNIFHRTTMGESWTGKFPVKNKSGERFLAIATNSPFYDDDGSLVGIICVSSDSRYFQEVATCSCCKKPMAADSNSARILLTSKGISDSQQPLQVAIASKLSNLATKVKTQATKVTNEVRSRIRTNENMNNDGVSGDNQHSELGTTLEHKEDATSSAFGESSSASNEKRYPVNIIKDKGDPEGKAGIHKIIGLKAEAWIAKKGLSWPRKYNEHDGPDARNRSVEQECDASQPRASESNGKPDSQVNESNRPGNNEASGSWSSYNANSTGSVSSSGSTTSGSTTHKMDIETDCLDYEILWEDLTICEQIGQGSCGTVYHALWYGSDVAVKVFSKLEYSDEVILTFRQEVSLMKKLRHPNILLFMGAVTSPQRLCIVTEFLPRGSLFRLLQRNTTKVDWRRRIHMAMDIARGMNYLHHCNPPIIHRDLKSSNLLVDKNWTVKVFLVFSRLKHETYVTTNTGKGTPQWMAPEVLRNEVADEKSDVYSYGVILWEIVTEKIPWDNLNSMQVIGAVGFMNKRLELPRDLDPKWVSIIESCWHSDPQCRPSFQEILERFKDLQRQYMVQSQLQRFAHGDAEQSAVKPNAKE